LTFSDFPSPSGASSVQMDKRSGSAAMEDAVQQVNAANRSNAVTDQRRFDLFCIKAGDSVHFSCEPDEQD